MHLIQIIIYLVKAGMRLWHVKVVLRDSDSWPVAQGTIFDGVVAAGEFDRWATHLMYSYSVSGEYYSGTYHQGFRNKNKAEAFLERFPRGLSIPVRHKPSAPTISTLNAEDVKIFLIGL
jgi:Protein of unknown function (DUF3592)